MRLLIRILNWAKSKIGKFPRINPLDPFKSHRSFKEQMNLNNTSADYLFGTIEQRHSIDWQEMRDSDLEICAVHPLINVSKTATIPYKKSVLDLMSEVMFEEFSQKIVCVRPDGKKIALVPLRDNWKVRGFSSRGIMTELPKACEEKVCELVFWSKEAVCSDEKMRSVIPPDLMENVEWWLVGIDPIAKS